MKRHKGKKEMTCLGGSFFSSCVKCLGGKEGPGWNEGEGRQEVMKNHPRRVVGAQS